MQADGRVIARLTKLIPELEYARETHVCWSTTTDAALAANPQIGSREFHRNCVAEYDERLGAIREAIGELLAIAAAAEDLRAENARLLGLLNSPELHDFTRGVVLEAGHQRERWGTDHDSGKGPQDWFWLVGYLAGKALASHLAGNTDKALHHTITAAAAMANWHGAILGRNNMRPGIDGDAALSTVAPVREGT